MFLASSFVTVFYHLAPYLLLLSGYLILPAITPIIDKHHAVFAVTPYVVLGFAALLGLHFNRSRVVLVAVLLSFGFGLLQSEPSTRLVLLLGLMLPWSLALISMSKDRTLLSFPNYALVIVMGVELGVSHWLLERPGHPLWGYLESGLIHWPALEQLVLPQVVVLSLVGTFLLLLIRWFLHRSPLNNALLAALMAFCLSLISFHISIPISTEPTIPIVVKFSIAGLVLLGSLVQDSYNMAYRDELTGLMGRRAMNEQLLGLGRRYVIAMLDVDHFKKFNDTHGHDVGDQVLKMVAVQMSKATGGGKVFRYGGEEFALIYPGRTLQQVKPHLEALRETIAGYPMTIRSQKRPKNSGKDSGKDRAKKQLRGGKRERSSSAGKGQVTVTVSIGVAQRIDSLKTPQQVIKAADQALYQAKRKGRNKVVAS